MAVTESSGANFDFGRVASRTFGLVGRNFVPFAVLSLIFAGLPAALVLFIQPTMVARAAAAQDQVTTLLVIYGAFFVSYLAGQVLSAALTRASVDDLSGKSVAIGAALSTGLALLLPIVGLSILMGLGMFVGFILLVIPGIYLALRWAVAAPVLVVERAGIFKAMER